MSRTMAGDLVRKARSWYDAGDRANAMRAASRALALDPQAEGAGELVMMLMLQPTTEPPRELRGMLVASDAGDISRHARAAFPGYILIAAVMLVVIANGVLDWPIVLGIIGSSLAMAVAARHLVKQPLWSIPAMIVYGSAS
jgi:hypothetical protein